ncbi:hypothetical protein CMO96_02235 [Candidatus Woesebacteria bacterium]|nr:hypothetical protein [Candidatus Woesebacteria bacterium]
MIEKIRSYTSRIQPWWTIIGAPIVQEAIFRFIPHQLLYVSTGKFWEIGITTSIIFASIHWYFGRRFVVLAFFAGLFYWWLMVNFGIIGAILGHSAVNIIWLRRRRRSRTE